jgi:hypothetical protein
VKIRTSLYADDAALFIRPITIDVSNLHCLLQQFGKATGLAVNIQKSEIFPINCSNIDLPSVLGEFQVRQGEFPCQYLGLPLKTGQLTRQDEQRLIDKVAARLPWWKGKMLNKTGRLTLVNYVLSSVAIYHRSVFSLSKWAIKRIDRIRRNFLWKGSEDARGGHCMVNWQRFQRPKSLGDLGVMDLAKFNRALRLRWIWQKWSTPNRPCSTMHPDTNETENALFRACTEATLGNGHKLRFWTDGWLGWCSPKELAPTLYKMAPRKNYSVEYGLEGGTWKRGLHKITTSTQTQEFVRLWHLLAPVQLSESPDTIKWRFTAAGSYSS